MSMTNVGALLVAGVLCSAAACAETHGQPDTTDATLSDLSLRAAAPSDENAGGGSLSHFSAETQDLGDALTALLTALILPLSGDELTLSPAFRSDVRSYTATVPYDETIVHLLATRSHPGASVETEGVSASGTPLKGMTKTTVNELEYTLPDGTTRRADVLSSFARVPAGESTIAVTVTSEDGDASQVYTIMLVRSEPVVKDAADGGRDANRGTANDGPPDISGTYAIAKGINPSGSTYRGRVVVTASGGRQFCFNWYIGRSRYGGCGSLEAGSGGSGWRISVDWGNRYRDSCVVGFQRRGMGVFGMVGRARTASVGEIGGGLGAIRAWRA